MRSHAPQKGLRAAVVAALFAVLVAAAAIGAGCGAKGSAQPGDVRASLASACSALVAKDAVAWYYALPTDDTSAELAVRQIYAGLARFPWAHVSAKAVPLGSGPGRYRVTFYGELVGADTSPLVCQRILDFAWRQGRLKVVADRTEEWSRDAYYLAFSDPVVIVRPHLVVVGDGWQKPLISRVAACDGQAQRVAARLQLDPKTSALARKTLVYVCASLDQAWKASTFRPDPRMAAGAVGQQIYIIDSRPRRWKRYTVETVRHELAHVYAGAFGKGKHFVGLLVEGLAVAAEGDRDFSALRTEVATGNRVLPLEKGLMHESVWKGLSDRQIDLAYLEGGALVLYLEKGWGMRRARAFAQAVADSDMTQADIERATRQSLGVSWGELYTGWKGYVRTLP